MDVTTVEEANAKFPIESVMAALKARIEADEYVPRAIGEKGEDYLEINPSAQWGIMDGFGLVLSVDLEVLCNEDQYEQMNSILEDDERVDDIDTGVGDAVGEIFDAAWASEGLEYNMETTTVYALMD